MLTTTNHARLRETLDRAIAMIGRERDWLSFVGCPFFDLAQVTTVVEDRGFHVVDCELFRYRRVKTDEFCELIGWGTYQAFAFVLPRSIPHSIASFLYQAVDHRIVSTEDSFSFGNKYRQLAEKAWLVIMTPEDFTNAELETGWDRSRLTRALGEYCWLTDHRN